MTYFSANYSNIKINIDDDVLRNAQIGAIHSICSHFTLKQTPALVVLPTGTGKTAVIVIFSYLLRAKRVLVLSSSVLVRGQIIDEFSKLSTLKERKIINSDVESPNVFEVKSPIRNTEQWEELKNYDVIVGIPNSIYSSINDIRPDKNIFDLILVDEAHHAPAKTWQGLLDYFSNCKQILFTATPFRRDKKEVPGKLIYNYPLSRIFKDKINSRIKDNNSKFIIGDGILLNQIFNQPKPINYSITIVQPGISKNNLTEKISTVLASTESYIESKNGLKFIVLASE